MTTERTRRAKTIAIDAADLAALGEGQVAYVKPMHSDEVRALFPQAPEMQPGLEAVRAAVGERRADPADRFPRRGPRQRLGARPADGQPALSSFGCRSGSLRHHASTAAIRRSRSSGRDSR